MSANKPVADAIADLIRERSDGIKIPEVFGSSEDPEQPGYESLLPSYAKAFLADQSPTVSIGGKHCAKPYQASIFNCSALSFGPLSKPFILAMNQAALQCGFYQNTGEAGISPFHFGKD